MALLRNLSIKLGQLVVVVLLVTLFSAFLIELLPGDPVTVLAPSASPEQRADLREELNLDDPFIVRYGRWLGDLVQGDLGNYFSANTPGSVADRLGNAMPRSLLLMFYA